jgi:putative ATPase
LFRVEPLDDDALRELANRALTDDARGLGNEPATIADDALQHLVERSEGDARHLLTVLEVAHALTVEAQRTEITLEDAEAAIALRSVKYGDDEHYDIISAFIKSIRGSDPDAGLYWLARMLEAGEDARFVARRLVILASEDIGLADPQALLVADAAARAVEYVGLPEAAINLAHAVLHLSLAPKSNTVITGLGAATDAARNRRAGPVPIHLRDAHYRGAQMLGHGKGYVYPHDTPTGWAPQEHLPVEVAGERFYRPSRHGAEPRLVQQWRARRGEELTPDGGHDDE